MSHISIIYPYIHDGSEASGNGAPWNWSLMTVNVTSGSIKGEEESLDVSSERYESPSWKLKSGSGSGICELTNQSRLGYSGGEALKKHGEKTDVFLAHYSM